MRAIQWIERKKEKGRARKPTHCGREAAINPRVVCLLLLLLWVLLLQLQLPS